MNGIYSVFNSVGSYNEPVHSHDGFMFMVPEFGLMHFTDEESSWSTTLVERQFLLVPPNYGHSTASMTKEQSHLVFYVEPDYMQFALRDLSGDANRALRTPTLGVWAGSAPLQYLLLAKRQMRQSGTTIDRSRQLSQTDHLLLLECVATALSMPSIQRSTTQRHGAALVRDIKAYISGNLDQSPDIETISEVFHVSRRHLTRLFAGHTGQTILGYVQDQRLARAKELLEHTRLPVLEIAQMVGFQSPSHFATVFRRVEGRSPHQWRHGTILN